MLRTDADFTIAYTYARGYYDGRSKGWCDTPIEWMNDNEKHAYNEGYDKGVADYCELDEKAAAQG